MKSILTITCFLLTGLLSGGTNEVDYVEGEDSTVAITPEIKAAAIQMLGPEAASGLIHAAELTMRKYDADMRSESGRRAWHGRLHHETVNTNGLYKLSTYTNHVDGTTWTYKSTFRPVPKVVSKRIVTTAMTNGIPARLAAARKARADQINAGTVVTNVVTEAR